MTTAAEPRPAELPLAGGRKDASVRVHPLLCATFRWPPGWAVGESGRMAWRKAAGFGVPRSEWLDGPIVAFLVEHPSAGLMLIDTGLHPSVAVDPKKNMGLAGGFAFKNLEMKSEQSVAAQLRSRGIDPSEIRTVVMTHLHIDHASGMSEFPEATFLFSKAEWEAATTQGQLHGYVTKQFDHAFDYRMHELEM